MKRTVANYWRDRHVVITGASSGIGLATTEQVLELGGRVTAIARESERLAALRRVPEAGDGRLLAVAADVGARADVAVALDAARAHHGPIGALVTSAGLGGAGYFPDLPDDEFESRMRVNYFGTLYPIRLALDDLRATRGSITCLSSVAGFVGVFGYGAYTPSKFAVRGLCEVLHQELRPDGVSVTGVYPPDVDTPMLAEEMKVKPPELRALSSGERPLSAERVARALVVGTARRRPMVLPGSSTPALRFLSGALPGVTTRIMDRTIAKARKQ